MYCRAHTKAMSHTLALPGCSLIVHVCVHGQAVQGVPEIQGELNPATWMLEITTPGMEHQLGVDFAQTYRESDLAK